MRGCIFLAYYRDFVTYLSFGAFVRQLRGNLVSQQILYNTKLRVLGWGV